ncbi:MAG: hypothetical protein KatS3mg060_1661 [Dehalococcoidia bacterium]|jgi:hypothetical protein|nr:MAG: hypothetical protein KatS3mg060_1661 [Dehalococcoidia bacterium]
MRSAVDRLRGPSGSSYRARVVVGRHPSTVTHERSGALQRAPPLAEANFANAPALERPTIVGVVLRLDGCDDLPDSCQTNETADR